MREIGIVFIFFVILGGASIFMGCAGDPCTLPGPYEYCQE